MKREADYVLKRLDEWNYKRIKEKYTLKVEAKIRKKLISSLRNRSFPEGLGPALEFVVSRNSILRKFGGTYSNFYPILENILENKSQSLFASIPDGIKNEYINPFLEKYIPFKRFIDEVRKRASKIFPEELNDKDIEESFRKIFPTLEEYSNYTINLTNTLPLPLEILSDLSLQEKKELKKITSSINKVIPDIVRIIMGDLYKYREPPKAVT